LIIIDRVALNYFEAALYFTHPIQLDGMFGEAGSFKLKDPLAFCIERWSRAILFLKKVDFNRIS
jgi:hypothetical protein